MMTLAEAGDGHDHGESAAPAAAPTLPRFAAVSDAFELVGVLNGTHLTLYLDHTSTNAPVKDAALELEVGGANIPVKPHGEGEFVATLSQPLTSGVVPVTAAVTAGGVSDLLAGQLDLHEMQSGAAPHVHGWWEWAGWGAAALLLLALTVWGVMRIAARRSARVGGVR